mmetsp:Transcript_15514/g.48844  ORF Transcript_15514/g.48844 Transcript_15514/m.48844 type:complete len:212 (+) Transcript_15514:191-826(+)
MVAHSGEIMVILAAVGLQIVYRMGYEHFAGPEGGLQSKPAAAALIPEQPEQAVQTPSGGESPDPQRGEAAKTRDARRGFLGHYELPGRYAFRVGDIVVHRGHGQVGVVVERFDVCQLSEAWHAANAPPGMTRDQPFYTILVSLPGQKFTRHGAQSSHRRWDAERDGGPPPPVQHPDVPRFFGELDAAAARYEPLNAAAREQEVHVKEWDRQ